MTNTTFEQYDAISTSGLFDPRFYREQYRDVEASGMDPVMHYLEIGAKEQRATHPDFDTSFYIEQCDARGIQVTNALLHYLSEGRDLGLLTRRGQQDVAIHPTPDEGEWMLQLVLASGLFDRAFYNKRYGLTYDSDLDALRDFYFYGYLKGRQPNLYFDSTWYLSKYPDIRAANVQPLFHYVVKGDAEGRLPSLIFDSGWYRQRYEIASNMNTLAHYLSNRTLCLYSPIPDFDADYYGDTNKDVRAAGVDPFEHFLFTGFREGRNPSPRFNLKYYVKRYLGGSLDSNPLLHYLDHKQEPGVFGVPPANEASVPRAVKHFSKPAAEFEEFRPLPRSTPRKAKVLAYYLPQFHAFPENDQWWGKGFTEWSNIARGVSRFKGHYQPRIPRDLGFYSLENALPTLRRQAEMAQAAGVYGFVYYYYWFNGKRLMERPIEQFLSAPDINMPFCLMWANENWTRRWDGDERDVLISQDYDPDDDRRLAADFARHFSDHRYIRIQGRPLMMIYRPGLIPRARAAIVRWRELFRNDFKEDPIIIMAQAFNDTDPGVYGLDGAIEFPPHKLTANMNSVNEGLDIIDVEFAGKVFSYDDVVARSLNEPVPSYPQIKTAVPSWDNDARRQGTGLILDGSTPAKYENWMRHLVDRARAAPFFGEPLICVNAWNEWCEAAYLEPDLHYGSAYLNATGRAVTGVKDSASQGTKILLVGQDAFPSGSQHLLLNIAKRLRGDHGVQVEFLLFGGGAMSENYRAAAPLTVITNNQDLPAFLEAASKRGYRNAIVNTTAASHVLPWLQTQGIEAITLIHELPRLIREKYLQASALKAFQLSRHIVVAAATVRDQVAEEIGVVPDARTLLLPQGTYKQLASTADEVSAFRAELTIADGEKLVLGIGYADLRKGFDLFLQLWRQLNRPDIGTRAHFCWVGDIDPGLREWLSVELKLAVASGSFHLIGYRSNVAPALFAADAYALMSREDPFPTVVHEALSAGLPIFAFADAGGMSSFLTENDMGTVVAQGDVLAMASAITHTLQRPADPAAAKKRKDFVRDHLDFGRYVNRLLELALPQLATVSVAVPNHNYARFMPERLGSVFQQTHPVHEVLVLDDCSTDDSLDVIPRVAEDWGRQITLFPNIKNSGSVFAQWRKAVELATGEYLWIAEADDLSASSFLSAVVGAMQMDPRICIGFSDSSTINYDGTPLWASYKAYYALVEPNALAASAVFEGAQFVRQYLAVRNLILNASAVVWRRQALLCALDACQKEVQTFRMAGDWRLYLEALLAPHARIAYVADPLNVHRRHAESVTHALKADLHVAEIIRCQEVACARLSLTKRELAAQKKYLQSIRVQLLSSNPGQSKVAAKRPTTKRKTKAA